MTSSRAAGAICPCMSPTSRPASSPAARRSYSSVADLASTRSDSPTSGQTTKARWPAATSARTRSQARSSPRVALAGQPLGRDRTAARRQLVERGQVEVAEDHHGRRARDRRGRHHEQVRVAVGPLGAQRRPLLHAEAVLLVDHDAPERSERDLLGQQRMRPDHDAHLARREAVEDRGACLPLHPAREQLDPYLAAHHAAGTLQVAQERAHRREVLLRQHLGRHHERTLVPALHCAQQGGQRDDGLARPHVALEEAVHGERPGHVGHDHRQRPPLRLRELVGQAGQEARHEGVGDRTGDLARRHVVVQRAGVHLEGTAPQHQRQLQTEELVEHEPSPRRFDRPRGTRARGWRGTPRSAPTDRAPTATRRGSGSVNSPARASASSTNSPISHDVSPTLAEAGYTGRMRSVRRPGVTPATTSTTGLTIWRAPRYSPTLPKKIASVPASSCLARQGWLKKTTANRPVSSRTVSVDHGAPVPGPPRAHRLHRRQHRGLVAHHESRDVGLARAVDVAPRIGRHEVEDGLDAELGQAGRLALRHRLEHRHGPAAQVAEGAAVTQSPAGTGRGAGRPGAPRARRRDAPRRATPRSASCPRPAPPRPRSASPARGTGRAAG